MNKNRLVFLLTTILLFSGMATDIYIPSLPDITAYFHTTIEITSFTVSIFIIASGISGLVASVISNRYGRKATLVYSNIVFIITTFIIAVSPSIYLFIFIRLIQGAAVGFNYIVTRQIINDLFDEKEQININSMMFTAYVISPALAPILGSLIAEYISWRACFVFLGLCEIYLLIEIKKFIIETLPGKKKIPNPITYMGSFCAFFMTKNFNACVLISSFTYAGYFIFLTISSYIFIDTLGFTAIGYSVIFIFLAAMYLVGNFIMRILNNHDMEKATIIFIGCLLNVVGCLFIGVAFISPFKVITILTLIIGAIFMRFGLGFMLALVQIMAMNQFKKNGGQALGALNIIQNIVASVAAIWASKYTNLLWGFFIVSSVFNGCSLIIHWALFEKKLRFTNLKAKVFRKMIKDAHMKKYIELNPYWEKHT